MEGDEDDEDDDDEEESVRRTRARARAQHRTARLHKATQRKHDTSLRSMMSSSVFRVQANLTRLLINVT